MVIRMLALLFAISTLCPCQGQSDWRPEASDSLQLGKDQIYAWPHQREAQIKHLTSIGIHPIQVHYFLEYLKVNGTPLSPFEILAVTGMRPIDAKAIYRQLHFAPERPHFDKVHQRGKIQFMSYWGVNPSRADALTFTERRSWRSIQRFSFSNQKIRFQFRLQHDPGTDKTSWFNFSFFKRGGQGWRSPDLIIGAFRTRIGQNSHLGAANNYIDLFRSYQRLPMHQIAAAGSPNDPLTRRGLAFQWSLRGSSLLAWYAIGSQDNDLAYPKYQALENWLKDREGYRPLHTYGLSFQRNSSSGRFGLSLLASRYGRVMQLGSIVNHFHVFKTAFAFGELYVSARDPWIWNEQLTLGPRGNSLRLYSNMKWRKDLLFEWDWAVIKEIETARGAIHLLLVRELGTLADAPPNSGKTRMGIMLKEIGRSGINLEYSYGINDQGDDYHHIRLQQRRKNEIYFTRKEFQLIRQETSWGWAYSLDLGLEQGKGKYIMGFNGFSVPKGLLYDFQYGLTYRMDFNPWHGSGHMIYALMKRDINDRLRLECKASQLSYYDRREISGLLTSIDAQRLYLELQLIWKADLNSVPGPRGASTSLPSAPSTFHSPFSGPGSFPAVPAPHSPMER